MATTSNVFDVKTGATQMSTPQPGLLGAQMQQVTAPTTTGQVAQIGTAQFNPNSQIAERADGGGYGVAFRDTNNWDVDGNQTVQGQVNGLLQAGNPLLEKAMADTRLDAASRGLLNSSMAAGAGRAAVIDKALQIATPDAQTFAAAGQFNANARNQTAADNQNARNQQAMFAADAANKASSQNAQASNALQQSQLDRTLQASRDNQGAWNSAVSQTAQMQQQASLANQQVGAQAAMAEYDTAFKTALANADAQNKLTLQAMDGQIKESLAAVEAQFKTQMQTSQSASTMYSQALDSISKIMTDKDLDAGAKQNMINQTMAALQNGLKLQASIASIPGLDTLIASIGGSASPAAVVAGGGTIAPAPAPAAPKLNPITPTAPQPVPVPYNPALPDYVPPDMGA